MGSISKMGSSFTIKQKPHSGLAKSVLLAKICKIISLNDFSIWRYKNKRFGISFTGSFFVDTVRHIVFLSSKEKMIWTNTKSVITTMTNKKFAIKFSIVKFIRKSVNRDHSSAVLSSFVNHSSDAIQPSSNRANPVPAIFCFVDFLPESLFKGFKFHALLLAHYFPTFNLITVV